MDIETLKLTEDFELELGDQIDTSYEKILQLDKYGAIIEFNNKKIKITCEKQNMLEKLLEQSYIDDANLLEQLNIATETQHAPEGVYIITENLGCEDINLESARECNCILYALNDSYFNIKFMNYLEFEDITYMKNYTELDEYELMNA